MNNRVWYVSALPWKDSPFKCSIVVLTCKGQEEAVKIWKEFYKNHDLEPDEACEVPFVKGTIDEEEVNESKSKNARPAS